MASNLGFVPADIMLPKGQDMNLWSVIACDQFTSQPEYWEAVERQVGEHPSTLRLMLPELYLDRPDTQARTDKIHQTMDEYIQNGVLKTLHQKYLYLERTLSDGSVRKGLIGALDLEAYDYKDGTAPLCRATEGTVLERIPPRMAVREKATLELPHVMLLVDDTDGILFAPLQQEKSQMDKMYDFKLMQQGGSVKGYALNDALTDQVQKGLQQLCDKAAEKDGDTPLLYLVGDGNHSLATAKACYEKIKAQDPGAAENHPARFALVEIVNLHDTALKFEPIHRVVFGVNADELLSFIKSKQPAGQPMQTVTVLHNGTKEALGFTHPTSKWTVGTLQQLLDEYIASHTGVTVDYIHDTAAVEELLQQKDTIGFLLPAIDKGLLFDTIRTQRILPRKAFSMGHARDKKYYLECRKIK